MAGIYIPDKELPKGEGSELIIRIQPDGEVLDLHKIHLGKKAIPVPDHGRLIDADALKSRATEGTDEHGRKCLLIKIGFVNTMPTIIPADKEADK